MNALTKLVNARIKFKQADTALAEALKRAYPLGAVVSATLGRARIRGPVVGHGGAGYHRGYITITNEATGKERSFYAADRILHDVAIQTLPSSGLER